MRLSRAPLFMPASRPELCAKAAASGADAVILDLEDSVAPQMKAAARSALATAVADVPLIVRINGAGTPWRLEDLAAIQALKLAGVMLPKVETVAEVAAVRALTNGLALICLIESAAGMANCRELAAALPEGRLAFGTVDYAADIGCAHERTALLHGRSEIVLASRLAGLAPPLDGVTLALKDVEAVGDDARHARELGFGGKLCVHPAQVQVVHAAFAPSAADVAWARRVLAADLGAGVIDGEMIDAPVRLQAQQILDAQAK